MNRSPARRRPHPIYIANMLRRVLFLLIIPLARGAVTAITGGFVAWVAGAWFDLTILGTMLAFALLRWWFCTYSFDGAALRLDQGILFRHETVLPWRQVCSVTLVRPFYLKPLGAVLVRADTAAGGVQRADFSLPMFRRQGELLLEAASPTLPENCLVRDYRPRNMAILVLSMVSSNSFAGLVLTATFISQLGQLAGEELSQRLMGTFRELTRALAFGIPPAAAAIAYLLLFGWLVGFGFNLVRHKNFRARRQAGQMTVWGGVFTNRVYQLTVGEINCVDIRQTLLTRLLHLSSVFLYVIGYGKKKDDVSALIPAATAGDLEKNLSLLLPEYLPAPRQLAPNLGAWFKFIWLPLYLCIGLIGGALAAAAWMPDWRRFLLFTGTMAALPAIWLLTIGLLELFTSGVSRRDDCFTLRYSKGFYLHTLVVPLERIVQVELRQHPFQTADDRCDLVVTLRSEGHHQVVVKNLERRKAALLFGIEPPVPTPWRGPVGAFQRRTWEKLRIPFQDRKPA